MNCRSCESLFLKYKKKMDLTSWPHAYRAEALLLHRWVSLPRISLPSLTIWFHPIEMKICLFASPFAGFVRLPEQMRIYKNTCEKKIATWKPLPELLVGLIRGRPIKQSSIETIVELLTYYSECICSPDVWRQKISLQFCADKERVRV